MIDIETLLKPSLGEAEVEIPGRGVVRVRGMSRDELYANGDEDITPKEREVLMLSTCMVEPKVTAEQVRLLQRNSKAMELNPVVDKINELSGIGEGSDREAYKSVRGKSES